MIELLDVEVHLGAPAVQVLWSWLHLFHILAMVSVIKVSSFMDVSFLKFSVVVLFFIFWNQVEVCCHFAAGVLCCLDTVLLMFDGAFQFLSTIRLCWLSLAMLCVSSFNWKDYKHQTIGLLRLQMLLLNGLPWYALFWKSKSPISPKACTKQCWRKL